MTEVMKRVRFFRMMLVIGRMLGMRIRWRKRSSRTPNMISSMGKKFTQWKLFRKRKMFRGTPKMIFRRMKRSMNSVVRPEIIIGWCALLLRG